MTEPGEPPTPCRKPCSEDHSSDPFRGPRKAPAAGSGRQWCTGHSKRTEGPCQNWAIPGGTVCDDHGGRAAQVREAAERRWVEMGAERAVQTFGLRRDVDPLSALLEEVQWTAGHVEWLRQKVQDTDPDALTWGLVETKTGVGKEGEPLDSRTERAAPSVWYALYLGERKHLKDVCGEAIRSGVAERTVRLEERRGEDMATALRWFMAGLALSADQVAAAVERAKEMFKALATGTVADLPAHRDLGQLPAGGGR